MQLIRRIFFSAIISVAVLFLIACSNPQDAEPEPTIVHVKLTEFAIDPSEITVPPGTVTLEIENAGFVEHDIVIEELDQGVDFVYPGQIHNFSAQLASGTYSLICTVAGHKEAGMVGTLIVEE